MEAQVFVTCVNESDVTTVWPEEHRTQMQTFHVEHGVIAASKPRAEAVSAADTDEC